MRNPRWEFVDAVNWLHGAITGLDADHDPDVWKEKLRRACIAFVDARCFQYERAASDCFQRADVNAPEFEAEVANQHKECRTALLREVGLEERDGKGE